MPAHSNRLADSIPSVLNAKAFGVGVLIATAIGLALRLDYISQHFLWYDEAATRHYMDLSWSDYAQWFGKGLDFHPPLYFALLRAASSVSFGLARIETLRYLNLVWLPASLAVFWWLGFRHPSRRVAVLGCCILLAVGPTFVYLGAELRSYGLFTFLAATLTVLVIHYADEPKVTRQQLAALSLVTILISYTHYSGLLVAGAILGAALIAGRITGHPRLGIMWVGVPVSIGFSAHLPALISQLDDREQIYSTGLSEASHFVLRGVGWVGWTLVGIALVGLAMAIKSRFRYRSEWDSSPRPWRDPGFLIPTLGSILLILGAVGVTAIANVDLLNLGVSLIPSLLVVLGAGTIAGSLDRLVSVALVSVAAFVSIGVTVVTNQDPSVFEPNRVSTVDVLYDARVNDPTLGWNFSSELTLVHVDWQYANEYFVAQARVLLPAARVVTVTLEDFNGLESSPEQAVGTTLQRVVAQSNGRTLVITRMRPLDHWVLSHVPLQFEAEVLNESLVELIPDLDDS